VSQLPDRLSQFGHYRLLGWGVLIEVISFGWFFGFPEWFPYAGSVGASLWMASFSVASIIGGAMIGLWVLRRWVS